MRISLSSLIHLEEDEWARVPMLHAPTKQLTIKIELT